MQIVIIGCKSDLEEERKVSKEDGIAVAGKYGVAFYEVSAKDGIGID